MRSKNNIWKIFRHGSNEESDSPVAVVHELEYHGEWMGDCFVTVTVNSAYPIDFHIGDYLVYRGERFVLNNVPSVNKKARSGSYGEGFTYSDVKFSALQTELTDIQFLDYVIADNNIHYTSLRDFRFFANDIDDFCDRLQANTNRWCESNGFAKSDYWRFFTPTHSGDGIVARRTIERFRLSGIYEQDSDAYGEWSAAYGGSFDTSNEEQNVNITVSNLSVWDALKLIKDKFGLNFIIRDRKVIIGNAGLPTNHIFEYGRGNGLSEIERTADIDQQVITKLFAYGSEKNMPIRYYANLNLQCYATLMKEDVQNASYYFIRVPFNDASKCFTKKYSIVVTSSFYGGEQSGNQSLEGYRVEVTHEGLPNVNLFVCSPSAVTSFWKAWASTHDGVIRQDILDRLEGYEDSNSSVVIAYNSAIQLTDGASILFTWGINKDLWPSDLRSASNHLPNNMSVGFLMLPGFPEKSLYEWVKQHGGTATDDSSGKATWKGYTAYFSTDPLQPYIQSLNSDELGIRESAKNFDGTDGEEIYPTIENTGDDELSGSDVIMDNGIYDDSDSAPTINITLPFPTSDFALDQLVQMGTQDGGSPTIVMKSGYCGGCEFKMLTDEDSIRDVDGKWEVTCERYYNSLLQIYFPYSDSASHGYTAESDEPFQLRGGDKYVLTGIPMTDYYIAKASEQLLEKSLLLLSKNDYTRFTYLPKVDEIYMARQHDFAVANDVRSLYLTLKEGDLMLFDDADLGIDTSSIFIDTLTIKENGNNGIPTYEVTLRNDKSVGTIQRLQEQINSLVSGGGISGVGSGSGGGMSTKQTQQVVEAYGEKLYLSKTKADTAAGEIGFLKGLWVKAKGLFGIDSDGDATVNNLTVESSGTIKGDAKIGQNVEIGGKATVNDLRSDNYSGSTFADTGFRIWKNSESGATTAVFDYLTVRKKMTLNSIEIKETHVSAGDTAFTMASAEIARTDYYYDDPNGGSQLLGYTTMTVPWILRGMMMVLGKRFATGDGRYPFGKNSGLAPIFGFQKRVRINITEEQLKRCNRIRCYFLAKDGEREIENHFMVNDLALCETFNLVSSKRDTYTPAANEQAGIIDLSDVRGNIFWWRKIYDCSYNTGEQRYILADSDGNPTKSTTTDPNDIHIYHNAAGEARLGRRGTWYPQVDDNHQPVTIDGMTYHWFDVEFDYDVEQGNFAQGRHTNHAALNSTIPAAGDKVVQFGNTTNPDRMNAFVIEVNGASNPDAPCWKIYKGIHSFDINDDWWNGSAGAGTCKWNVGPNGSWAYATEFHWITETYTRREVVYVDGHWEDRDFEVDDYSLENGYRVVDGEWVSPAVDDYYPDYFDDIHDEQGHFVSRKNGKPKNYVRKFYYYEAVSHMGSMWLCSIAGGGHWTALETFSYTDAATGQTKTCVGGTVVSFEDFRNIPLEVRDGKFKYAGLYAIEEPTSASNDWSEMVEKGDPGSFMSRVFTRTNKDISHYRPQGGTFASPFPTVTVYTDDDGEEQEDASIVWHDGTVSGDYKMWSTTAWFYSDGTHSEWTSPVPETDTSTLDVEFSPFSTLPETPFGSDASVKDSDQIRLARNGQGWFDPVLNAPVYGANGEVLEAIGNIVDRPMKERIAQLGLTWNDMVWRGERRIANDQYAGTWAITKIKGENSVRIDLDNENDSMLYSSGGSSPASDNVISTASMYDGSTDVSSQAEWNVRAVGCVLSSEATSRHIVVTGMTATEGYVEVTGTYTDKNGGRYSKTARLTLKKLVDVDKYSLSITPKAIAYNVSNDPDGSATVPVTIQVWKTYIDSVTKSAKTVLSTPPDGYRIRVKSGSRDVTVPDNGALSEVVLTISPNEHDSLLVRIARIDDFETFHDTENILINKSYNGAEAPGNERVYIRTKTNVAPVIVADETSMSEHLLTDYVPTVNGIGRSDIELNGGSSSRPKCTASPQGVSRQYPYEWKSERRKSEVNERTGKRSWLDYSGSMVLDGVYAESNCKLDTDNDTDILAVCLEGSARKTLFNRTISTVVRFYDGATEIDISGLIPNGSGSPLTITGAPSASIASMRASKSGKGLLVAWVFGGGVTVADFYDIAIGYTYGETGQAYETRLKILTVVSDTLYQLIPSHKSLPCVRNNADNTLSAPPSLSLKVTKIQSFNTGEAVATKTNLTNWNLQVRYRIDGATPASVTDGDAWPDNNSLQLTTAHEEVRIALFALIGSNYVFMDGEPVPVVKDGLNGDGIKGITKTYAISAQSSTASDTTAPTISGSWSKNSPAVTEEYPYLWAKEVTEYDYKDSTTRYYVQGARGQNGIDAQDIEWVYVRTTDNVKPIIVDESGTGHLADDFLPLAKVTIGRIKGGMEANANATVRCTDDPQGVDDEWQYEWEIKREKGPATNGHRAWTKYSGTMSLHNNYAASPLVIDIDNDNDQFGTDSDGKVIDEQTRTTNVTMFYGAQQQAFTAQPAATLYWENGTALTAAEQQRVASVAVDNYAAGKTDYNVSVTVKATGSNNIVFGDGSGQHSGLYVAISGTCAKGTKTIRFTLGVLKGGTQGVSPTIYQLNPTKKSFSFTRDTQNNLTPSSISSQINVAKTIGNTTTQLTSAQAGLTYSWGFDDSSTSQESNKAVGSSIRISASDAANHTNVWVRLSTGDNEDYPIVKDGAKGDDGLSQQSYMDYQEAWSQYYTSTNSATPPADCTSDSVWSTSTPAKPTGKEYLWRRSRTMTLKADKSGYTAGSWGNYICLSGTNGTSIAVKGHVATVSNLPTTHSDGDAYVVDGSNGATPPENGHLFMWSGEANQWIDIGKFKGDNGTTYYIHVAWAEGITIGAQSATKTGQTNTPNASACTAFSISPADSYDWMGILIDTDSADSTNWRYYTWKYARGNDGTSPWIADLDNEMDSVACEYGTGKVAVEREVETNLSMYYGSTKKSFKITSVKRNGTALTSGTASNGVTATFPSDASTARTVKVKYATTAIINDKDDIAITLQPVDATTETRVLHFTVNGIRPGKAGDSAVLYSLVPSCKEIAVKKNGSRVPSGNVTCSVVKTDGQSAPVTATTGFYLKAFKDGAEQSSSAIAASGVNTNIVYELYVPNASGVLVDRETIPVVADGTDGKNSVRLALDNEHEDFLYSASGLVAPSGGATSQARLYDGANQVTSGIAWAVSCNDGSTWVSAGTNTNGNAVANISSSGLLTITAINIDSVKIKVRATYNNLPYYAEFTANKTQQDKYDLVVKPNAIAFNSSETWTNKTITLSADRTDLQGNVTKGVSIQTTAVDGLRLYYSYVKSDGSLENKDSGSTVTGDNSMRQTSASFTLIKDRTTAYIGIYFELRLYSGSTYRRCDYETVEIAKTENGASGRGYFPSEMFVRLTIHTAPTAPTSDKGSYSNPHPSGCVAGTNAAGSTVYWSDGIPDGDEQIWMTRRYFTSDGLYQDGAWSTPRKMSDTTTYDVEFALKQANDAIPPAPDASNRHGGSGTQIWFDPDDDKYMPNGVVLRDFSEMYWRAERRCINGVWGGYTIYRIKGEKGDPGGKANGVEEWFLAIGGNSRPAVPAVDVSGAAPTSTINGTSYTWHRETAANPAWDATNKYLFKKDKYLLTDGTSYWGDTKFYSEWADQGPKGDDSYTVEVTPAVMIFTESTQKSGNVYPLINDEQTATVTVKKGTSNAAVAFTLTVDDFWHCDADINPNNSHGIVVQGVTGSSVEGYVEVSVNITNGPTIPVKILLYYNRNGSWQESIEGGVETIVANKVTYDYINGVVSRNGFSFDSIRSAVSSLETWKSTKESTYDGYATTIESQNTRLSDAESNISTIQTTVNGHTTSISAIEQKANRISLNVTSVDSMWEQGRTQNETAGNSYEAMKTSSATRIRTKSLIAVDGTLRYKVSTYNCQLYFLYFDENMLLCSGSGAVSGWQKIYSGSQNVWKTLSGVPSTCKYVGIILAYTANSSITPSAMESIEVELDGVDKDMTLKSGLKRTGIDIEAGKIDMTSDKFTLRNNDGEQTMGVDENGNVEVSGTVKAYNFYHKCVTFWPSENYSPMQRQYMGVDSNGFVHGKIYEQSYLNGLESTNSSAFSYYNTNKSSLFIPCTGTADVVNVTTNTSTDFDDSDSLMLPDPATCQGKLIELHTYNRGGTGYIMYVHSTAELEYRPVMTPAVYPASGVLTCANEDYDYEVILGHHYKFRSTYIESKNNWVWWCIEV